MPGPELAQYGIAFFTVAGLFYVFGQWLKHKDKSDANQVNLAEVVQNNTKALEQLATAIQTIQISLARQEQKIDEILERARR